MIIQLTRDSVCAGDDFDAPHPAEAHLPLGANLVDLGHWITKNAYLPSIAGGASVWVVEQDKIEIATLAHQPPSIMLTRNLDLSAKDAIHLRYKDLPNPMAYFDTITHQR